MHIDVGKMAEDNNNDKKRGRDSRQVEAPSVSNHHNPKTDEGGQKIDSFLSSMTFAASGGATAVRGGCDCDECGGSAFTPQAIVDAIRRHKRLRNETGPMKRSQLRELVNRHGSISVYKFTMPIDAAPLVEYGTSHRLIWIRQLPTSSVMKTIGKGIVGSQDEERGRKELTTWREGDSYLVPSNGGKAVAWIHSQLTSSVGEESSSPSDASKRDLLKDNNSGTTKPNTNGGHAVLYICKIPKENVDINRSAYDEPKHKEVPADEGEGPEWHEIVRKTCESELRVLENGSVKDTNGMLYQKLSEENSCLLLETLSNL